MALIEFENEDKYFIKFFLLDATLNMNRWGVTAKALADNLQTFIGKPFVLTPNFDHPNAVNGDDLMVQQEKYRVGDIIEVGVEPRSGKAWGLAEITNDKAKNILKNGEVQFVSPSIVFDTFDEKVVDGNTVITSFTGAHVAAVSDPAYGMQKAEIKGKCNGSSDTCLSQLKRVQASRSACGKYTKIKVGKKFITIAANDCVEKCIRNKIQSGMKLDDQALAICYSECGESSKIEQENTPTETESAHRLEDRPSKKTQEELDEDYELQMQSFNKKDTSDKAKNMNDNNDMKRANDEKEEREEAEDPNKLDLTDRQEEYLHDKEESKKSKRSRKAEEDEEKKYEEEMSKASDEDDKEKDADDDEEDKKEASLKAQVRSLKSELKALKAKVKSAELEPIINSIIDAKAKLGKIDERAEYASLSKMNRETLEDLAQNYTHVVEASQKPRYQVQYSNASVDKTVKGDSLITRIRGGLE